MSKKPRTPSLFKELERNHAATLLACGESPEAVGLNLGKSERTIRNWLGERDFAKDVRRIQGELRQKLETEILEGSIADRAVRVRELDELFGRHKRLLKAREVSDDKPETGLLVEGGYDRAVPAEMRAILREVAVQTLQLKEERGAAEGGRLILEID